MPDELLRCDSEASWELVLKNVSLLAAIRIGFWPITHCLDQSQALPEPGPRADVAPLPSPPAARYAHAGPGALTAQLAAILRALPVRLDLATPAQAWGGTARLAEMFA